MIFLFGHFLGILVVLGFPPTGAWPLTWIAGILAFQFFLDKNRTQKQLAVFFFSLALGVQVWSHYWLSYTLKEFGGVNWLVSILLTVLLFSVISLFAGLFGYFWPRLRSKFPEKYWVLVLAMYLSLWEHFDFRLFPWTFCQSVGNDPLLLASVYYLKTTGWNLMFLTVSGVGALLLQIPDSKKRVPALVALFALVFGPAYILGYKARSYLKAQYKDRQPVALLQGNVGNYEKKLAKTGDFPTIENVISIHRDIIETAAIYFHSEYDLKGREPWVLWPETSFPGMPFSNARHQEILRNFVMLTGGLHIVGTYDRGDIKLGDQTQEVDFNVAAFYHEDQGLLGRYRKIVRVPFGEYVPGDRFFPGIYSAIPNLVHFGSGEEPELFVHPDSRGPIFIPLVCYEMLMPDLVDRFRKLAEEKYPGREIVLANLVNDSWYGSTMEPFSHSLFARWAAVRQGLPLLRPTNTGLSQIVAPWGEVVATGPRDTTWVVLGEVPVKHAYRKAMLSDAGE